MDFLLDYMDIIYITESLNPAAFYNRLLNIALENWNVLQMQKIPVHEILKITTIIIEENFQFNRADIQSYISHSLTGIIFINNSNQEEVSSVMEEIADDRCAILSIDSSDFQLREVIRMIDIRIKIHNNPGRFYSRLFHNRLITLIVDLETGFILDANEAASTFYGYSVPQLKAMNFNDLNDDSICEDDLIADEIHDPFFRSRHKCASGELRVVDIFFSMAEYNKSTILYIVIFDATTKDKKEKALKQSESRIRAAIGYAIDWEYLQDLEGQFIYLAPSCYEFTGYTDEEFLNDPELLSKIIYEDDREKFLDHRLAEMSTEDPLELTFRIKTKIGDVRYIKHRCHSIPDTDNVIMGRKIINSDITSQSEINDRLNLTVSVLENILEAVIITDENQRILMTNAAFTNVTGYDQGDVIGKTPRILASGRHDRLFFETMWRSIISFGYWKGEIWNKRKNGEFYPEWLHITSLKNSSGQTLNYIGIFSDITTRKQAENRLHFLTHHDPLTSLPNRNLLFSDLEIMISDQDGNPKDLCMIVVDIIRFKRINESLNHQIGDLLLVAVADRLKAGLGDNTMIARMGGDEFGIIVPGIKNGQQAIIVSHEIQKLFDTSFNIQGREIHINISLGVSLFPEDASNARDLIRKAEIARDRSRDEGTSFVNIYTPQMESGVLNRLSMENDLRVALKKEEFVLYYQPQIDLKTGEVVGVEALIRWKKEDGIVVSPGDFIPLAEEIGLIDDIGSWVLNEVCRQQLRWQSSGMKPIIISFNFSAMQFNNGMAADAINRTLSKYDVDRSLLEIEITENVAMNDFDLSLSILKRIERLGLKIAIDDFGTGYSSLVYLNRFPLHKIKIDRSFIMDIKTGGESDSLISAIVAMGKGMNMTTVAEGVETSTQLEYLRAIGCDLAQGYLFMKPKLPDELEEFINTQERIFQ